MFNCGQRIEATGLVETETACLVPDSLEPVKSLPTFKSFFKCTILGGKLSLVVADLSVFQPISMCLYINKLYIYIYKFILYRPMYIRTYIYIYLVFFVCFIERLQKSLKMFQLVHLLVLTLLTK